MPLGILFAVVFGAIAWAIASYKRLASLRAQVLSGWRQVDVLLKRRHDLVPNLVSAVRGAAAVEKESLTAVMEARAKALTATGPLDAARKEEQLSQAIGRLFAVAPALAANDQVKALHDELSAAENKVGAARQTYNDSAAAFNSAQRTFPASIFAALFQPAELFQSTDGRER